MGIQWLKKFGISVQQANGIWDAAGIGNRSFLRSRNRAVSDRLKPFTLDELYALVFRLDIAETVEPLDEVAERLRDEMVKELELRKK